jgi:two-component system, LytTR family, sensor kinase
MKIQQAIDQLYLFIRRKPVYHALFWAFFYLILVKIGSENIPIRDTMRNEFVSLIFFMVAVYINVRLLIPKYLARHAFFYVLSILILALLVTPIKIFVLYLCFSSSDLLRLNLIQNQIPLYVGMLFIVLCSTVLKLLTDWWRYEQEKTHLVTQSMQSELRFLRSQINPHFLFNTLNNLYALTLTKNDKAPDVVLKLAEIMRYMLYDCNERQVNIDREISFIQNYIALERLRLNSDTDVSFEVEGNPDHQLIVPLLFVPLLENSFKHGLNRQLDSGGFVHIRLKILGPHLTFFIENSKPLNLPLNLQPHKGGIGLRNLTSRLKMNYPFRYHINIDETPERYTATLEIDLKGYYAVAIN